MTLTRPRLVILPGDPPVEAGLIEALREHFEVRRLEDPAEIEAMAADDPATTVVSSAETLQRLARGVPADAATAVLQHVGEGVGLVDAEGSITWRNGRLTEYDDEVRKRFADLGRQAVELFNRSPAGETGRARSRKFAFRCGDRHFELVASPATTVETEGVEQVTAAVAVLWDVSAGRRLLDKLDAIDAAGGELMKIEAESIAKLSTTERLQLLEEKIVHYVHDLLHFDDFEIRLLDPETNRLDLVMAIGINPLRIGEVIFAEMEGNGISGYVAASGESYLCADVQKDALYREGLDNAASSLTVPLRLHDRTIGVFNIESSTQGAFNENDRQFATIFGRYIAMAMNILNLLVVERYTTNEEVASNVLGELEGPLADITSQAEALRKQDVSDELRVGIDEIIEAVGRVRQKVDAVCSGPKNILGAEQELRRDKPDPEMIGKRVLIADDDTEIRDSVSAILTHRGCLVTACPDGRQTIDIIEASEDGGLDFDLVISDIKMPDRSGYEVFRATKSKSPDTPVILMTGFGYDPHHSIVRASQEGLQSFLFKPFKAQQLVEEVRKAFALKTADG